MLANGLWGVKEKSGSAAAVRNTRRPRRGEPPPRVHAGTLSRDPRRATTAARYRALDMALPISRATALVVTSRWRSPWIPSAGSSA